MAELMVKIMEKEITEYVGRYRRRNDRLTPQGKEFGSSVPIAPPVGYKKQPSLAEQIRLMVRSERLRQEALAAGAETFEEADDFDVGDDFEPSSPYEEVFEPTVADTPAAPAEADPTPAPATPLAETSQ